MQAVAPEADAGIERWLDGDQPKWDTIDFELPCSRCGYDLRMLTLPRCPECGLQFAWRDIIEARRRRNEFLFEYRWRERPVRSWLLTAFSGLRPWRFWRRVSIHEHVRAGPLLVFLLSAVPAFLVTTHAVAGALWLIFWSASRVPGGPTARFFGGQTLPVFRLLADFAVEMALLSINAGPAYVYVALAAFLILGAATFLLVSLRQTLGRCRVRSAQVLRVAAYAAVPATITCGALLVASIVGVGCLTLYIAPSLGDVVTLGLALTVPVLVLGVYLSVGLRHYLQLPRPWLLGFTASAVAVLFTLTAFMFTTVLLQGGW